MSDNFNENVTIKDLFGFLPYTEQYNTISFDLFDTLIYRKYFTFDEVKNRVYSYIVAFTDNRYNFDQVKFTCEHFNNLLKDSKRISSDEPLLVDIYKTALSALKIDESLAEKVVKYELNLEMNNLILFNDVIPILTKLKEAGKKLVILSDMYFDKNQIIQILTKVGIVQFFDEIYVSSEYKERKHTSKLFRLIFPVTDGVIHIGDNENNDYKQALKANIDAVHLVRNISHHMGDVLPLTYVNDKDSLIELMSEAFVGMVVNSLEYALTHNINKVFFLSRDATPLFEVAKQAILASGSIYQDILIDELCIGRNSLGYMDIRQGKHFLEDVFDQYSWLHHGQVSLSDLVESFGLDATLVAENQKFLTWSDRQSAKQASQIIKKHNPQLYSAIESYINEQNTLAVSYLYDMGAIGNGKVVFVDVGYSGTVLRYIAHHLTREGTNELRKNTDIHMLMLATTDNYINNSHFSQPYGVIREGIILTKDALPAILKTNFSWLEAFFKNCYPERGPLLCYQKEGEIITPYFRKNEQEYENPLLEEIIKLSSHKLVTQPLIKYLNHSYIVQIRNLMIGVFANPSQALIDVMKDLKQEFSPLQTEVKGLLYEANGYRTLKRINYMIQNDYWVAGSFKANGIGELIGSFDEIKDSKNKFPHWYKFNKQKMGLK